MYKKIGRPKTRYTFVCLTCQKEFDVVGVTKRKFPKNCEDCRGTWWPKWKPKMIWAETECQFCGAWKTSVNGEPCNNECATMRAKYQEWESKKSERVQKYWAQYNEYEQEFDFDLKERVREKYGRRCLLCGAEPNGRRLDVHHINYSKTDSDEKNLIPLCRSCHAITSRNRKQWPKIFNHLRKSDR